MPGAAQDLAFATPVVFARGRGKGRAMDAAKAERPALVRAAVAERVERAVDVEHPDRPSGHLDDLPPSGRDLCDLAYDVASWLSACVARHPASSFLRSAVSLMLRFGPCRRS